MDKETLGQYRVLLLEIEQLEEQKQQLAAGLVGAVQVTGLPKAGGLADPTGRVAAKLADLAALMADKLNQALSLRLEIEQLVEGLEPGERMLMRSRYIEGKTWEQVAEDLHYTYQWVFKLHKRIITRLGLE